MPHKIPRPCRAHLCPNTTDKHNGYCPEHQSLAGDRRASASRRGYDRRWSAFRLRYLADNPLCMDCLAGIGATPPAAAAEVHHIRKLADYPNLKYTNTNLMALCHQCHSRRTARGE